MGNALGTFARDGLSNMSGAHRSPSQFGEQALQRLVSHGVVGQGVRGMRKEAASLEELRCGRTVSSFHPKDLVGQLHDHVMPHKAEAGLNTLSFMSSLEGDHPLLKDWLRFWPSASP